MRKSGKNRVDKEAFTLVEVLIALVSMSIIIGLCIAIISAGGRSLNQEAVNTSILGTGYENMNYMSREIQSAVALKVSEDGKKLYIRSSGVQAVVGGKPYYDIRYEIRPINNSKLGELVLSTGNTATAKEIKVATLIYDESRFTAENGSQYVDLWGTGNATANELKSLVLPGECRVLHISKPGAGWIALEVSGINLSAAHLLDKNGGPGIVVVPNEDVKALNGVVNSISEYRIQMQPDFSDSNGLTGTGYSDSVAANGTIGGFKVASGKTACRFYYDDIWVAVYAPVNYTTGTSGTEIPDISRILWDTSGYKNQSVGIKLELARNVKDEKNTSSTTLQFSVCARNDDVQPLVVSNADWSNK